ncbi:uncharacterized protein MELLADRAFT_63427 [Melampsora larici-populina 98AG31]|uniref:Uncharacterized protein n=1 Tax=Melampsora larici-populina (strain 98AG31 / pathotype 3-4-7) TaxID=747676 RepID=F4RML4_MELLP|nr:uncharacterized protein MELLADRAFT_63427 [Melampsora larici-populina 98AG31]EGG06444.1 hypothetical protein MELLADRAFT_63427 [Melampsora larici-populina 98AG31]
MDQTVIKRNLTTPSAPKDSGYDSDLTDLSDLTVYCRRSQVAHHLHRVFTAPSATQIRVDFDLAVAFFLQHTKHLNLGDIPFSIEKVLADFSILDPLTGRQANLRYCTVYIKHTLDAHAADPQSSKPFALRYPNLTSLNNLAIERSVAPKIVGKDGAVILLDVAGRVVAIGVPPKKESPMGTTLTGTERGRLALAGAAEVTNLGVFHGPATKDMIDQTPTRPFEVRDDASSRLSGADSSQVQWPGTVTGFMPYQAVGYGRYSSLSAGMSNTNMAFGKARQGHPDSNWQQTKVTEFNLPTLIQMGQEHAYKRETNARVESELLWHHEQARLLIKAFQPASYDAALQSLRVIIRKGTPAASRVFTGLVHPIGIGRHTMLGMQVDHHRDGHNAPLFASANFFGQHYGGGELILNYLGYALCGDPGYSVHAAFDILMHGVTRITRLPNKADLPPQRICMALYSHSDVFAGAARYSGMQQRPMVFSDSALWIPFYPDAFEISKIIASFLAEKKRLDKKYLAEKKQKKLEEAGCYE